MSSILTLCVVPAADTTFSSIIVLPKSLQPYDRDSLPISGPIVTQEDWKFGILSSMMRLAATIRRYSSGFAFSSLRLVLSGWNGHEIKALKPGDGYPSA